MMTVRNRVNMRAVYFILSLLLISCSKDDASETPGKFELQSISIGEKQDQSSFENVAPSASIVLHSQMQWMKLRFRVISY